MQCPFPGLGLLGHLAGCVRSLCPSPGHPSSPYSLHGRNHSHHPLVWEALSLPSAPMCQARAPPQPTWPSLPATCPEVSWMLCPPPLAHASPATTHVCSGSPLCPQCPGPVARPHLGHGGLSHSLSPGSHCPPGLLAVPTRSPRRGLLGPVGTAGSWVSPGCTPHQGPIWHLLSAPL